MNLSHRLQQQQQQQQQTSGQTLPSHISAAAAPNAGGARLPPITTSSSLPSSIAHPPQQYLSGGLRQPSPSLLSRPTGGTPLGNQLPSTQAPGTQPRPLLQAQPTTQQFRPPALGIPGGHPGSQDLPLQNYTWGTPEASQASHGTALPSSATAPPGAASAALPSQHFLGGVGAGSGVVEEGRGGAADRAGGGGGVGSGHTRGVPSDRGMQESGAAEQGGAAAGASQNLMDKRTLQELLRSIDPSADLSPEVEEALLDIGDEFVHSVTSFTCQLARHRKSAVLEPKDIILHLERNWNMRIPGYSSDDFRPFKRPAVSELHRQRVASVRRTVAATASDSAGGAGAYAFTQPSGNGPSERGAGEHS